MLVGRSVERKFLEHYYDLEGHHIVVVYGQKNMGKTSLLKEFAQDKPWTYYQARACSAREQLWQWGRELRERGAVLPEYPDYQDVFRSLLRDDLIQTKQILLLDEFHHIVRGSPEFMQELVRFIDNRRISRPVMVILCTSASGWVENSMVRKIGEASFYLNGLLKIKEMKFTDIHSLFPGYSTKECLEAYAILGGIPGLWKSFDPSLSVEENIIHNILDRESRLHEEMSVYMAEELREPAIYNTILAALAVGRHKLNDIYLHTGFSRAKISVYLKNLMELDLVEKVFSFETKGNANTQKGFYRIASPFVRFYFRFLFPNQSILQRTDAEAFYRQIIKDALPHFTEEAYKKVCREQLERLAHEGRVPFSFTEAGEWVGKCGNLDLVARDRQGKILIALCRYAEKMTCEDLERLLYSAKKAMLKPSAVWLFCAAGFEGALCHKAEETPMLTLCTIGENG